MNFSNIAASSCVSKLQPTGWPNFLKLGVDMAFSSQGKQASSGQGLGKSTKKRHIRRRSFILEEINTPSALIPGGLSEWNPLKHILETFSHLGLHLPINLHFLALDGGTCPTTPSTNDPGVPLPDFDPLGLRHNGVPPQTPFNLDSAIATLPPPTTLPIDPPGTGSGNVNNPVTLDPKQFDFPLSSQPLVGDIDTGLNANNPYFNYNNIKEGYNYVDNTNNSLIQSGNQHGTFTFGIIDSINQTAPKWVGDAIGSGKWAESLIDFVNAAKASGQKNAIANLSLDLTQKNSDGTVTTRYEFTPEERAALEYARENNVLIVTAAGNDGSVMSALGQSSQEFDNVITVGSGNSNGRYDYSSYGNGLDILADGGTTANPLESTVGDGLGTMAGTSGATAKVTGAASLVWAANPELSYSQVIDILEKTANNLGTPGWNQDTGFGLLNVVAAVQLAKNTTPEVQATPPILTPTTWGGEGQVTPLERADSDQGSIPESWQMSSSAKGVGQIAVSRDQDGCLEAFTIGADNQVYRACQTSPNGGWSNWSELPGETAKSLTVAQNQDGRLEVFAINTDNQVDHIWQTTPNGTWSNWNTLANGADVQDLTVGQDASGNLEVFAIDTNNQVIHTWQGGSQGGWSDWGPMSGVAAKSITVGRNSDGRLELFTIGTDGNVYHNWQTTPNGTWSNWNTLANGADVQDLTVGQDASGNLEVFAIDTNNQVIHTWQGGSQGGWSIWGPMSGVAAKSITVGRNPDGRLELFTIGTDGNVYHNWQTTPNGSWDNWGILANSVDAQDLTVSQDADGHLEAFAINTDNQVIHSWYSSQGGWSNWGPISSNSVSNSAVISDYTISQSFFNVYQQNQNSLGNPIGDVQSLSNGISYQNFENGSIINSPNGTFPLYGPISQQYLNDGALNGNSLQNLGVPTSPIYTDQNGFQTQYFENGSIVWDGQQAVTYDSANGVPVASINDIPSSEPQQNIIYGINNVSSESSNLIGDVGNLTSDTPNLIGDVGTILQLPYNNNILQLPGIVKVSSGSIDDLLKGAQRLPLKSGVDPVIQYEKNGGWSLIWEDYQNLTEGLNPIQKETRDGLLWVTKLPDGSKAIGRNFSSGNLLTIEIQNPDSNTIRDQIY